MGHTLSSMFEIGILKRSKTSSHTRVGIAIGVEGILAVRVSGVFDARPRIEACAYHPDASEDEWPQAFAEFERVLSAENIPVVVSVNPKIASLLQLSLPDVPKAEIPSALKFRAREISPIPIEDMVLDYVEVPGMRMRGKEKMGYCAVARLSQMRKLRDAINSANLKLTVIDVEEMVLRHLLACFQQSDDNAALLFIAKQASRVIAARKDRLYLFRSSHIGAQHIEARSIQGERSGTAEIGRQKDSLEKGRLDQDEGMDLDRIDALVLEIQRTLDFYDSHFTDPPPRQVWLSPDWPFIPALAHRLGEQLRIPVRKMELEEIFEGTQKLSGQPADLAFLALGAAMRPREVGSSR